MEYCGRSDSKSSTNIVIVEKPDRLLLEKLIQSSALSLAEVTALKALREKIDNKTGFVKVEYSHDGFGRFRATTMALRRDLRSILYGEKYDYFDISNCAGNVMCQVFNRFGLPTISLTQYNDCREEFLQKLMDQQEKPIDQSTAITIILDELFLSGSGHTHTQYLLPPFVEELKKEFVSNLEYILTLPQFQVVKEYVIKKQQEKCTKQSIPFEEPCLGQFGTMIYQNEERRILEVLIKELQIIEKDRYLQNMIGALMFDGFHVDKTLGVSSYLPRLEAAVKRDLQYHIQLELRNMTVNDEVREKYLSGAIDLSYESLRAEFEKRRFKTKTGKFPFHTLHGDEIISRDKHNFQVAHEDWMVDGLEFLKEWFKDPNKRSYESIVYACVNEEKQQPNIYYAFPTLRWKTFTSTSTEEEKTNHISFFQNYISLLVEGDPKFTNNPERADEEKSSKWLTFWLADILLNPDDKGSQPVAVILWGKPGCGKTSLRHLMSKLLGEKCVHHTTDPNKNGDILHEFNSTLQYKLFIEFEEINMKTHSQLADAIKQLITNHTHSITRKGQESIDVHASERALFTTNCATSCVLDKGDRRYCAFAVSSTRIGQSEYWDKFYQYLEDPNFIRDVADYLVSFKQEVKHFAFRDARPITAYYKSLIQLSFPPELDFLKDKLFYYESDWAVYRDQSDSQYLVPSSKMCEMYNQWRVNHGLDGKISAKSLTARLESFGDEYGISHKKTSSNNVFVILIKKAKEILKNEFAITEDDPSFEHARNALKRKADEDII